MKTVLQRATTLLLCLLLCKTNIFSQAIIDYQAWNPSSPPCNLFASSTNVPATINGTSTTIAHQSTIGQPTYNTTSKLIDLPCSTANSASMNLGTEYQLAYTFKAGYRYNITAVAYRGKANPNDVDATLRFKLNNGGSGASTLCNGPGNIDPSTSGNLTYGVQVTAAATPSNFGVNIPTVPSDQAFVNIAAVPPVGSDLQIIELRKITITETGTPEFTPSPATPLSISCGDPTARTFTLTNTYNLPDVTSYEWDLGSSSNGWLYNGTAAPQNISTTTGSLTLTPACGSVLQNISVTVKVNGVTYKTYTYTVTTAIPTFSILGDNICTGSETYSLSGSLPCNASVTWNSGLSRVVTPRTGTGSSITLTKSADGPFTLTASISGVCSATPVTVQQSFIAGPTLINLSGPYNSQNQIVNVATEGDQYYFMAVANPVESPAPSYVWTLTPPPGSSSFPTLWAGSTIFLTFNETGIYTLSVTKTNSCGSTTTQMSVNAQPFMGFSGKPAVAQGGSDSIATLSSVALYPNPVTNVLSVSLPAKNVTNATIKVFDAAGKLIRSVNAVTQTTNINMAGLAKGTYYIEVYNGTTRSFTKPIIKN